MKLSSIQKPMNHAMTVFQQLTKKYPELDGYLVLSLPGGQVEITRGPLEWLEELPELFESDCRRSADC